MTAINNSWEYCSIKSPSCSWCYIFPLCILWKRFTTTELLLTSSVFTISSNLSGSTLVGLLRTWENWISKSNNISAKLICQFSYELAKPLMDKINTPFLQQTVNRHSGIGHMSLFVLCHHWQLVPSCSIDHFSKISQTFLKHFIAHGKMEAMKYCLNPKQFGNIKGASTSHCLIEILPHFMSMHTCQDQFLRWCLWTSPKSLIMLNTWSLFQNSSKWELIHLLFLG